ncbi:MAG: type II secretion system major pseudopilin GspG [Fimbriimonas sp.]|nr:type II secretion system major pseudopilin GspG [Fimbriimonas sp.]
MTSIQTRGSLRDGLSVGYFRRKAVILGSAVLLLAAVAVPSCLGALRSDKTARAKADLATLRLAIDQFRLDCSRYPTTNEGLKALWVAPKGAKDWRGPYLSSHQPKDPWGHPYVYATHGSATKPGFVVKSYGADGKPGGTGENADIADGK